VPWLQPAARKRIPARELNVEIADLKTQLKEARSVRQAAERAARGRVKDRIEVLNKKRFEDVKQARNASGLHRGNYNAVCVSYERARAATLKKRAAHANAQLQFHRFVPVPIRRSRSSRCGRIFMTSSRAVNAAAPSYFAPLRNVIDAFERKPRSFRRGMRNASVACTLVLPV
jgi:hypothetical protein